MKANHNSIFYWTVPRNVVYQVKDTIFWKQITTNQQFTFTKPLLFIKSKIQFFESKSQQKKNIHINRICCLSSQRYNFLKANHNKQALRSCLFIVVYQVKDTIFWKQITTQQYGWEDETKLFIKSKIQFFESKSQRWCDIQAMTLRCLSSQRYNFLKANHNWLVRQQTNDTVVYQVKDTIFWKQITTVDCIIISSPSCLSSQRYNFLKANHNTN